MALRLCSWPAAQAASEALAAPWGARSASHCPQRSAQRVPKGAAWLLRWQPLSPHPSAAAWACLLQALQPALARPQRVTVPADATARAVRQALMSRRIESFQEQPQAADIGSSRLQSEVKIERSIQDEHHLCFDEGCWS